MGLQFQRGLSDRDWELEERVTKKSCGAGRRSVYKVLIQAAKMEIPVKERFARGPLPVDDAINRRRSRLLGSA